MGLILAKCDVCGYEGNDVYYDDGVGSWLCHDCDIKHQIERLDQRIIENGKYITLQISEMKKEIQKYKSKLIRK